MANPWAERRLATYERWSRQAQVALGVSAGAAVVTVFVLLFSTLNSGYVTLWAFALASAPLATVLTLWLVPRCYQWAIERARAALDANRGHAAFG